jgi:hypothetical protein
MELPEEIPCHSLQFYRFWWGYHISFYVFRFFFGTDLKTRWICFWLSYWMIPLISPGAGSGTWRATNPATGRLWFARSVGCSLARKGSELALAINRHQQSRLGPKDTMGTLHYRWRWFRGWQPYMKIDFNRILAKWSEQHWLRSGSFRNAVHLLQERWLIHVALRRHQCQRFSGYAIGRAGGETWGIGMGCKLV